METEEREKRMGGHKKVYRGAGKNKRKSGVQYRKKRWLYRETEERRGEEDEWTQERRYRGAGKNKGKGGV